MGRLEEKRIVLAATLGLWSCLTLSVAHAGEPLAKMASSLIHASGAAHAAAGLRLPANRLDLRPPALGMGASLANARKEMDFPQVKKSAAINNESPARWSELAGPGDGQRVPSRAEQLVRNFHREGLPVAKLFQSENSLIHLGLNNKGKPGLWIVEKIH